MTIEQIYTGCLAQGAYYIEHLGEAAIIDPLREIKPYLDKLEKEEVKLKYIFETHFHADFVSGHIDLAKATGAEIVYGPSAETSYDIHQAKDGEIFKLGKVEIIALHTPGHTMESTTYLLRDEAGIDHAIFTGDTLFIGDVGRPDLAIKSDMTREDLAGILFESLRNKIIPLADDLIVYPGHGAGSACGKNMSSETVDSLGHQKKTNYALRADMTKEEFINEVTDNILPPPQYFAKNAYLNKMGYGSIDEVLEKGVVPLDLDTFEAIVEHEGALVIDTRDQHTFARGYIPNSLFVGIDGSFASWVGTLISDIEQPIVFISEPGREEEVVTRLARVGYDNTLGYLDGGFDAWVKAGKDVDTMASVDVAEFEAKVNNGNSMKVLDVRRPGEWEAEHVVESTNIPLDYLNDHTNELNKAQEYYIYCQSGYRSMVAASILKPRGFSNLVDVDCGINAIRETSIPLTEYVCPTTLQ